MRTADACLSPSLEKSEIKGKKWNYPLKERNEMEKRLNEDRIGSELPLSDLFRESGQSAEGVSFVALGPK